MRQRLYISYEPSVRFMFDFLVYFGNFFNGSYRDYRVYVGIMAKKMETTIAYE